MQMEQLHRFPLVISSLLNEKRTRPQWQRENPSRRLVILRVSVENLKSYSARYWRSTKETDYAKSFEA